MRLKPQAEDPARARGNRRERQLRPCACPRACLSARQARGLAVAAIVVCCLAGVSPGRASRPSSGPASRPENLLPAASLKHSAVDMVHAPAGTEGRAGRLVALTRLAHALAPSDPQINRLLANVIYGSQGKYSLAAAAARAYLEARPQDHMQGLHWLRLGLETAGGAGKREPFLNSVMDQSALPAALRAEAAAELARELRKQGKKAEAARALARALKLDPQNRLAIELRLAGEKVAPADRVRDMLALVRANPLDVHVVWQLAGLLDSLGLYGQSLRFFEHAWIMAGRHGQPQPQALAAEYLNAIMDAGQFGRAVQTFQPLLKRYPQGADLRSMLVEAHRALGQAGQAEKILATLAREYESRKAGAQLSQSFAVELAWFQLFTLRRPQAALAYARQAAQIDAADPVIQRILGVAELKTSATASGLKRLEKLLTKDIYAAAFLAEHYFVNNDKPAAEEAIAAGAALSRSGPAYRLLAKLAKERQVPIPPAAGSKACAKLADTFGNRYLQMARNPEKFIAAAMRPTAGRVPPGEPVGVTATLANIGAVAVPIGERGLLNPTMSLKVLVGDGAGITFDSLPLVVWPAPRYLAPGQAVHCNVRLDVGKLKAYLARRPLDELTLTVRAGAIGPIQVGRKFISSVPAVRVPDVVITRASILGNFYRSAPADWPRAYQYVLGLIVRDFKRGSLPQRMRAARQVGSLLALARQVEQRRARPPKPLADTFTKPVLLSMLRAVLQDRSPVVRAEMVAALAHAEMDSSILRLLGPVIGDPAALVRLRVVELIGASGTRGRRTIVDHLARDSNEFVRMMASAFRTSTSPPESSAPRRGGS